LKVGVVGLGYAGLCTAACLATKFEVVGVDVAESRVLRLNSGEVPIHEKGLSPLLRKDRAKGTLVFSSSYGSLRDSEVVFVAVGTPSKRDGAVDLSQVESACEAIGQEMARGEGKPTIVIKSTVVPGTATKVAKPLLEKASGMRCGTGFGLCSNPEFLREGAAIEDTLHPDRIVIGPVDDISGTALRAFYRKFYGWRLPPIVETSPENAELIKYASNTFLATKISFINLIARICDKLPGADVNAVALGMGIDPRIGRQYLQAGPGFGGACFPKDSRALAAYLEHVGIDASLLRAVLKINDTQPDWILSIVEKKLGTTRGKNVALLGVAFKEESDDVRESRAIVLVKALLEKGAKVRLSDPMAMDAAKIELGNNVRYFRNARECIKGADAAIVMTAWKDFRGLKPGDFAKLMRTPILIDARRIYDPQKYQHGALDYTGMGLGDSK
jgi:UDPglucose 6-dehydrogenase